MTLRPRRLHWIAALALGLSSLTFVVYMAQGDISKWGVLLPTAFLANVIVWGGPESSGLGEQWLAVFLIVTLLVWTMIWLLIIRAAAHMTGRLLRRRAVE